MSYTQLQRRKRILAAFVVAILAIAIYEWLAHVAAVGSQSSPLWIPLVLVFGPPVTLSIGLWWGLVDRGVKSIPGIGLAVIAALVWAVFLLAQHGYLDLH